MRVSVKVGSNKVYIPIQKTTTCKDLIKSALAECKINQKPLSKEILKDDHSSQYSLFERALGIERMVHHSENIFQIWLKWSLNNNHRIEFLIRMSTFKNIVLKKTSRRSYSPERIYKVYRSKFATPTNVCDYKKTNVPVEERIKNTLIDTNIVPKVERNSSVVKTTRKFTKAIRKSTLIDNPKLLTSCIRRQRSQSSIDALINLI